MLQSRLLNKVTEVLVITISDNRLLYLNEKAVIFNTMFGQDV